MKKYNISLNLPRIYLKYVIISLQTKKYPFISSASKNNTNNDFPKLFAQSSCKLAIWVECKGHMIFMWGRWGSVQSLKPS